MENMPNFLSGEITKHYHTNQISVIYKSHKDAVMNHKKRCSRQKKN